MKFSKEDAPTMEAMSTEDKSTFEARQRERHRLSEEPIHEEYREETMGNIPEETVQCTQQ